MSAVDWFLAAQRAVDAIGIFCLVGIAMCVFLAGCAVTGDGVRAVRRRYHVRHTAHPTTSVRRVERQRAYDWAAHEETVA